MEETVNDGVGIYRTTSPLRAEIAKTRADLRQECNVQKERRRELEFLEKGGNPLDFKLCPATSVSFRSTSLMQQLVTSEAIESGIPEAPSGCKRNSADNRVHLNGDNIRLEGERNHIYPSRSSLTPSEQPSKLDGNHNEKESNDSAVVRHMPKIQPYTRRNRSRSNRVSIKPHSTDSAPIGDGIRSSTSDSCNCSRVTKDLYKISILKDHSISSISILESTFPNVSMSFGTLASNTQLDMKFNAVQPEGTTGGPTKVGLPDTECNLTLSENLQSQSEGYSQHPRIDTGQVSRISNSPATDMVREGEIGDLFSHQDCTPHPATKKLKSFCMGQNSGFMPSKNTKANSAINSKGLESDTSFNQFCRQSHGNNASVECPYLRKLISNVNAKDQTSTVEGISKLDVNLSKGNNEMKFVDIVSNDCNSSGQNLSKNGSWVKVEGQMCNKRSGTENEVITCTYDAKFGHNDHISLKRKGNSNEQSIDNSKSKMTGSCSQSRPSRNVNSSNCELPGDTLSGRSSPNGPETRTSLGDNLKVVNRAHEDSILKAAKTIKVKNTRIAELSAHSFLDKRQKSHWDYVLEEMAWLAHDFAQERLWKLSAAFQVSHWVASNVQSWFAERKLRRKQRKVVHTLSKAIMQFWRSAEETSKHLEDQSSRQSLRCTVHEYASRFLKYNTSLGFSVQPETPITADKISDLGDMEIPCEVQCFKESLFYTVSPGAMEHYRKLVESDLPEHERTGSNMHKEEAGTSICNTRAEFQSRGNASEINEEEMGITPNIAGALRGREKSLRSSLNGQKNLPKSYTVQPYEVGRDLPCKRPIQHKLDDQSSIPMVKRPSNIIGLGSIPTKRVRTSSKKRAQCPLIRGASGGVQVETKIDVSSGDTSSFQHKQNTVHAELQIRKNLNVESTREYREQLPTESTELLATPRKAKSKHLDSAYEQRWQRDPMMPKELMPAGQSGLGTSWFPSGDQALLDFVHAFGPNWELVSDSINSTLLFKGKFLRPKECKEWYDVLVERDAGDGSDSDQDHVGSSQPYPFTLPNISKDSARDMSQRLGGTIEVNALKSRFQKIILIGKQQHALRSQNNYLDQQQIIPVHSSQVLPLSRVSSNGGPLMPLDLCDSTTSGPDAISLGYQGCHTSGLALSDEVFMVPVLPNSGASSRQQGSSGMTVGNSLVTPCTALTASIRYSQRSHMPRPPSSLMSERQQVRHLSRVLSTSKTLQSSLSVRGDLPVSDRGVQMLRGRSDMRMIHGINKSTPMPKHGLQELGTPPINMSSSGSVLSSDHSVRMPTASMHTGATSGQGNSTVRPSEALRAVRPQHSEGQRQMKKQELQMQATQGTSQGISGARTGFSNQLGFSPVQKNPPQQQQKISQQSQQLSNPDHSHLQGIKHAADTQQYAIPRPAKEKQIRQQFLDRHHHNKQQQQLWHHVAVFNSSKSNSQLDSSPLVSSCLKDRFSGQQQVSSPSASLPEPSSPVSKKHKLQTQKLCSESSSRGLRPSGEDGKTMTVAPQAASTARENHCKQRQHPRLAKGVNGRDTTCQNLTDDPSHVINPSITPSDQVAEKLRRDGHAPVTQRTE